MAENPMKSIREILGLGKPTPTSSVSKEEEVRNRLNLFNTGTGYSIKQVEKVFDCKECEDREIVAIGLDPYGLTLYADCICKVKKNAARKLKSSGLTPQQLKYSLTDYRVNDGNRKMYQGVEKYLKSWPELIKSSSDAKGFLLLGNAGVGKTMLASIIARDMLDKGIQVVFVSSADLLAELRDAQFRKDESGIEAKIETLAKAQALILDDVGKEKPTEWIQSMYYRLIDLRYRNNLLTGFTTNYYPKPLEERLGDFGEATVSRILGMTVDYLLYAKDYDHRTKR